MKLSSLLAYSLYATSGILAVAIDRSALSNSIDNSIDNELIAARADQVMQMTSVQVWYSARGGANQFRILGGLRLVPALRALWADQGTDMAKAFYTDFLQKARSQFGSLSFMNRVALYKDGLEVNGGVVGLQFESLTFTQADVQQHLDFIKSYFLDNNHLPLDLQEVSDAFNIGGPLIMENASKKRDSLDTRDEACFSYDIVSAFRPVQWNPYAPIHGIAECDAIPEN